jgi:hypothetical protein
MTPNPNLSPTILEFQHRNCTCEKPIKKPSAGCPACWTCEICGKFGGCDNYAFIEHNTINIAPELKREIINGTALHDKQWTYSGKN